MGGDYKAALRNARTALTGAENAGRVHGYGRAQELGIELKQEWLAALDDRTRSSHRHLDEEKVAVGEKFSNGCRYPGDPEAPAREVYNCRCTLVAALDGIDQDEAARNTKKLGMSYEEWKYGKEQYKEAELEKATSHKKGNKHLAVKQKRYEADLEAFDRNVSDKKTRKVLKQKLGKATNNVILDMRKMLQDHSGLKQESLAYFDLDTGVRLGWATGPLGKAEVQPTEEMKARAKEAIDMGHRIGSLHNHPGSSIPSFDDLRSCKKSGAAIGCIVAHDGST